MVIVVVDKNEKIADELVPYILGIYPDSSIVTFESGYPAIAYVKNHVVDVAFLSMGIPDLSGISLGYEIHNIQPCTNIIYCSSHEEYLPQAFRKVRCNGFITKPVDQKKVSWELEHLRRPLKVDFC